MSEQWLAARWSAPANVVAGMSLRGGGYSIGPYEGCNVGLSVGDAADVVMANRDALADELAIPMAPLWLNQVHGSEVVDADEFGHDAVPRADAAISRRGRPLAIQTADCLPILACSRQGDVVGAAHGGWRGLAGGVIDALLAAMAVSPSELSVWVGPGICQQHYEVGAEVRDAFCRRHADFAVHFRPTRPGHFLCDLPAIAATELRRLGVGAVHEAALCTYSDAGRFFSYRRDGRTGRHASLIFAR
ncbi:MAG: peptidoglycan editing factor PgeF [Pseudomonadota bacterium]